MASRIKQGGCIKQRQQKSGSGEKGLLDTWMTAAGPAAGDGSTIEGGGERRPHPGRTLSPRQQTRMVAAALAGSSPVNELPARKFTSIILINVRNIVLLPISHLLDLSYRFLT